MIRLSFIVPFYNVEPYIEECIRSLYDQDIPQEEYEVICVDDCSPDGSRAIVERLQKEYPTLRLLVHEENKRQGGARNTGLREANGQYIWFVDSDDYIESNCLKKLLTVAEKNQLDVLKFYSQVAGRKKADIYNSTTPVMTGSDLIFDIDTGEELMDKCNVVWRQLIKTDLIRRHKIYFAEHVQYEDDDYTYMLYAYAQRAMIMPEASYVWREIPNSTTSRANDLHRVQDIYIQSLRLDQMRQILVNQDVRWEQIVRRCMDINFNHQIFKMLKDCSLSEQLYFWYHDRKHIHRFKRYLTRKSYAKLSSFILWKLLQK